MPVTETSHDEDTKTLTMVARFAAPPERVWDVYADPVSSSGCGDRRPIPPPSSTTRLNPEVGSPTS